MVVPNCPRPIRLEACRSHARAEGTAGTRPSAWRLLQAKSGEARELRSISLCDVRRSWAIDTFYQKEEAGEGG
jgi:hypothetical protein